MPLTDVDLCAAALLKIGATPIASLTDPGPEGECARRLYPVVRDALLCAHPWGFTMTVRVLLPATTTPIADYANLFPLPDDVLRTVSAGAGDTARGLTYRIEGTALLADAGQVTLAYQRRPPEAEFPAFFVSALIARLAAEFCLPVTEDSVRTQTLFKLAEAELRLARLLDSQQATPRRIEDFSLIAARLS